jgi:2-polyprenyl-3-methyl-5-hydroxy-6-metoxy-1,4-benzoquinol methylase
MLLLLKHREIQKKERMDNPDCDQRLLFNTYHQFKTINKYFSGWRKIYTELIRPYAQSKQEPCSILDIGCGSCDVLTQFFEWAKHDQIPLILQGIDPDPHIKEYLKLYPIDESITFTQRTLEEQLKDTKRYDFIISNNLVHHLSQDGLLEMLSDAQLICNKSIIFNDIRRSDMAYILFKFIAKLFYRDSFAQDDGGMSIKRSYTSNELQQLLPQTYTVKKIFPYRNLIISENLC